MTPIRNLQPGARFTPAPPPPGAGLHPDEMQRRSMPWTVEGPCAKDSSVVWAARVGDGWRDRWHRDAIVELISDSE